MKRSEMISRIEETIMHQEVAFGTALDLAELVLNRLERLGMMPPLIKKVKVYDGQEYISFVYEWEAEDKKIE